MPYVINGFGTWNHGRTNTVSLPDFCDKCGRFGFLSSYNTRTYVVALFLPIVPLGKKRILNHCPACNRWREMKLRDWQALSEQVREEVRQVFDQRLNDAGAIAAALNQLIGIQDVASFEAYAPSAEDAHSGDASVMLALGQGYGYFGRLTEAERAYRASLAIQDSPEAHEGLAFALLQRNRGAEAAPHLRHVLEEKQTEKTGLLYFLVEGLQAEGQHDAAYALVETVFGAFPALAKDKAWAKLRKLAQKHRGSTKPLKRVTLTPKGGPARDRSARRATFATVGLVLILTAAYFSVAFAEGRSRAVQIVNGLDRPYTVEIDGQAHYLPADESTTVKLREGEHTVHAAELGLPTETIAIRTNFFARPFREEVVILNPDRVALVLFERTEYMVEVDDSARYEYEILTNAPVHTFPHVHFAFEEFPDEIEMEGDRTMQSRVSELEVEPQSVAGVLYGELDEAAFMENLVQRFRYAPNNIHYVQSLAMLMEADAFMEEIREALTARPVYVDLHRTYQTVGDGPDGALDLEAEYAALLEAEPDNADLKYLAARASRDRARALALYQEAAEAGNAYALSAIGSYGHLGIGEFDEALRAIDAALALQPDNPTFKYARNLAWLALGDIDSFLAAVPQSRDGTPEDFEGLETMALYMGVRGDPFEDVAGLAAKFLRASERESGPVTNEQRTFVTETVEYWYAFGQGTEAYLAKVEGSEDPYDQLAAATIRGDAPRAAELAEDLETGLETPQMLYLLSAESGDTTAAEEHLSQVAWGMAQALDWESRLVASVLRGEETRSAEELCALGMPPSEKRMVLALLAARFPEDRDIYLPLARRLNFEREYPYHELDAYLTRVGY